MIDTYDMRINATAREYLGRIDLENPELIAYELLQNGITLSWLYPEMPIISGELEERRVYN